MNFQQRKSSVALLSVLSNTTLVLTKLIVGLLIGSVSVISEAIHSGVDLLAAIIALFAVKTSGKPADHDHPYGHGKIENLSGTIEALLIFVAAAWIVYEATKKLIHRTPLDAPAWGIAVMLLSAVMNIIVSKMLFKVGEATDSIALQADAWHLRTDVWTSFGVMGGLSIILGGRLAFPGISLDWVDPVTAIAVALLIVRAAWHLTLESGRDLLDVSLSDEEVQWVRSVMAEDRPDVRGMHNLRTRRAGASRFIECHVLVDPTISVERSHAITEEIEESIGHKIPHANVTIHIEPGEPEENGSMTGGQGKQLSEGVPNTMSDTSPTIGEIGPF